MEQDYNFIDVNQLIKQLDDSYIEETNDSLYNSNYICEY